MIQMKAGVSIEADATSLQEMWTDVDPNIELETSPGHKLLLP